MEWGTKNEDLWRDTFLNGRIESLVIHSAYSLRSIAAFCVS